MRAALLTLLVLAAPVSAADADKEYYPLKVGTTWSYTLTTQQEKKTEKVVDTYVLTALKEDKVGEQPCVVFEAKVGGKMVATEHIAILKDGVYRLKFSDQSIEPAVCFFKAAAKKGDTWTQDFKVSETAATGKYEMDVEDVEVRAGKFKGALVVRGEAIEKAGADKKTTKTTIWFAKNYGMVKQVIIMDDLRIILELEKMDEPKK
jgi:hypothetical protein